jgi:hypothetical protein
MNDLQESEIIDYFIGGKKDESKCNTLEKHSC